MYGKPRSQKMTRLFAEAKKGDKQITVETGLDLVPGDRIALAATTYAFMASDDMFVSTYDNLTGIATLTKTLEHYHWGASQSTVSKYGVDIRGEVMILSRNIIIAG